MNKTSDSPAPPGKQDKPWPIERVRGYLRKRGKLMFETARGRIFLGRPLGKPQAWAFLIAEDAWHCYRRDRGTLTAFRYAQAKLAPRVVISDAAARKVLKRVGNSIDRYAQKGERYRPTSMAVTRNQLGVTAEEAERYGWMPDDDERKALKRECDRKRRAKANAADKAMEAKRKRDWRAQRGRGAARAAEAERKRVEIAASGRSRATYYRTRETERVRETKRVRAPLLTVVSWRGRLSSHRFADAATAYGSNGHDLGRSPALAGLKPCRRRERPIQRERIVAEQESIHELGITMTTIEAWQIEAVDRLFSTMTMGWRH